MELRLPELSSGSDEVTITAWHARENSRVARDQDLVEVATDKATFDVPSPCDGVLLKIMKKEGSGVGPGEVIAEIKEDGLA